MSYHDIEATFRPIDRWPGEETAERQRSKFKAKWSATLALLRREFWYLEATDVVCQVAIDERRIRQDGYPYANAVADHPGVIIAFGSKYGPLKYATDVFDDWEDNIRAIALALEALRKVDRYGVTKRGEQYTGWKALPASAGHPTFYTESAARYIAEHSDGWEGDDLIADKDVAREAYRSAARRLHPDLGGDTAKFQLLQQAKRTLDQHHGG